MLKNAELLKIFSLSASSTIVCYENPNIYTDGKSVGDVNETADQFMNGPKDTGDNLWCEQATDLSSVSCKGSCMGPEGAKISVKV